MKTFPFRFAWTLFLMGITSLLPAQSTTETLTVREVKSVVYGKYKNTDLMLDVYIPRQGAKGRGLIYMASGGWKSGPQSLSRLSPMVRKLAADSGLTVFAVSHISQPGCVVSEVVPQVLRSVRFVRANAARYGVDPARLGAMGISSGGHLTLMLAVQGGDGKEDSSDPVERVSSRVQAAAAFCPPTDFLNYGAPGKFDLGTGVLKPFRAAFFREEPPKSETAMGRLVSPLYFVSHGDAPTLLIHGDKDTLVPIQQSESFQAAMKKAGVECELTVKQGAAHGWNDMSADLLQATEWIDRHLSETSNAE
ncbi:MAG: alpha/beta hydrolase [bacterium]|nr:alpha/beta hydrolase [bacterium]